MQESANKNLFTPPARISNFHPAIRSGYHTRWALSGFVATNPPLSPCLLQLPVALRVDLLLPPRHMSFGVMYPVALFQPDVVVVFHVSAYQTPCIIQRLRRSWPDKTARFGRES